MAKASAEEARNRAMAQFAKAKKDQADAWSERDKLRQADAEKTLRLRALRLAKEAADKEAAAANPKPAPKPKPVRKVTAKPKTEKFTSEDDAPDVE